MRAPLDFGVDLRRDERDAFQDKLHGFVAAHEKMLMEVEQTFDSRWDPELWDPHSDTVALQLGTPASRQREGATSIADTLGRTQLHNRLFYRITLCFASLVLEMDSLAEEAFAVFIPPLAMFGDDSCRDEGIPDEEAQQGAGRMLGLLQELWAWVRRVRRVVLQTVRQLAALYSPLREHDNYRPFTQVRFLRVWRSLADLFAALVSVEEVLQTHDTLRRGLSVYRKLLAQAAKNRDKFDYDDMTMGLFGRLLEKIDQDLLDDGVLQRLVMQAYDVPEAQVSVTANRRLCLEFTDLLDHLLGAVEENVGTPREGHARRQYLGVLGLYYLHLHLFPGLTSETTRRGLCRRVFQLHHRMPVIYLHGVHLFRPVLWLSRRVPGELNRYLQDPSREGIAAIKKACEQSGAELLPQLNRLTTLVSAWIAEMETTLPVDPAHHKAFLHSTTLMLQRGILLAQHIQRLLINHIALHNCADVAISLQQVDGLSHGVELLMMIRAAFHAKTGVVASAYNLLVRSIAYVMERHLYELYLRLGDFVQTSSDEVMDQHSAIRQAIVLLHRPQTAENLVCLDLVLSTAFNRRQVERGASAIVTQKHCEEILIAFAQLQRVTSLQGALHAATDCDFLYWHRETFYPIFFERMYQRPLRSGYLPYLLMAMHDCRPSILASRHVEDAGPLLDAYVAYVRGCIRSRLIDPLCIDIENDLRLYTHSVVLGQPFRRVEAGAACDVGRFTRLPPLRLFHDWLHLATEVEHCLDAQFYNLNALMANDWKTYEEMRNLALVRYGLRLCDGYLPGSIVDQGLDVLVITENIQVFVANYTYNMNEQLFVQRPSTTESKHLHTLHIRHIANSIRTHGTGIMNTTVNYVYKCLLKKLAILSQFLYDEHVKSRLIKDAKFFAAHKEELNGAYPLSRAEKFIREVRKLGVAEDGQPFLEKFRHLVSEIGNALGYMRMMRSGGLRAIADAAAFIPFINGDVRLERVIDPAAIGSDDEAEAEAEAEAAEDVSAAAPPCTVEAVRVVDKVVHNMRRKLSDGSEYFRMLLEAVTKRLRDAEKYHHLRNFHMIVPSICVLHVELMIREKEQLVKKNKDGVFTDDGLALGCAFLLKLFGLSELFESLHWFESVGKHYAARLREMQEGIAERSQEARRRGRSQGIEAAHEDEAINNMHLTATMVDYAIREHTALKEAFVSSRVFFHSAVPGGEDEEAEEEEEN
ncbi:WASH complex subunit 7 [Trypanosoma conorhini]|uniref:WASH complex subunit 7 n=1 Tax=Trypanosoma conorhini TaxID=83891 RepID=A0A422NCB5_9TRYP|nr:WASH complex subunit 7 [Trypanosoma conorhini]RNF03128.1 WASH complex subunit 7 [Trypanosoma conorhini]